MLYSFPSNRLKINAQIFLDFGRQPGFFYFLPSFQAQGPDRQEASDHL
jgi:hypothetical protein